MALPGKNQSRDSLLQMAYLRMYAHAPLLMGIYNNYSGYYKVRRRLYVKEPFEKLNLSGRKNGPDKIWRLNTFGVMLRNMT